MDAEYIDNYYSRTLASRESFPSLEEETDTDVCIIGGGLAGLATALGLAERGKKTVLLEARRIGWGASGRNGGFVLAGFSADPRHIIKKAGLNQAQELYSQTRKARDLIRERIRKFNIPCDPVDGELAASWYDDPDPVRREVDFIAETFGEKIEFRSRDEIRESLKSKRYYDGYFLPDNFHMHPLNYLRGLTAEIRKKGGRIYENSKAGRIKETVNGLRVTTEKGVVTAKHVVFCGSAYFNGLNKKLQRSCLPIRTYVVKTEPVDEELLDRSIRVPYAIRDDRWADDYYRILPDRSILWGGRVGLGDAPKNLKSLMMRDMKHIYPQLKDVQAEIAWSGLMGYTVHKMPHIGRFQDNVWYCTNFCGCGVGPSTAGGEVIAAAIADQDESYRLYEPFGFEYTGGPLGPVVAQAVYRFWELRDRLREFSNRDNSA